MLLNHCRQMPVIRLIGHAVLGERFVGEGNRQVIAVQPDRDGIAGQAAFTIQTPVAEAHISGTVNDASEARRVEDAVQLLGRVVLATDPAQHLGRAMPVIRTLPVRPMHLVVVVGHPVVMDGEQLRPRGGLSEMPVGHPALHVEGGLDKGLPRLARRNRQFQDAHAVVDVLRLFGPKDTTAVTDERFWGTVLADGGEEHYQVGSEILPARQAAGQDGSAVVLQNRDAVDPVVIESVVELADVDRPVLVPTISPEGHGLRLMRLACGARETIELAVEGEDAATGPWTELDAKLLEGRVDAELAQFGILLQLAYRQHGAQVDLAHAGFARMALIVQTEYALVDPALQGPRDGPSIDAEIAGDAGGGLPLTMQPNDGQAAFSSVTNRMIGRVAPQPTDRYRFLGQDAFDRVGTRSASEAGRADGGDLIRAERWVLRLELDDSLPDLIREVVLPCGNRREEAGHPVGLEACRLAIERALRCARLASTFGW